MRWLFVRNFGLRRFLKLIKLSVFLLLVSMHLAVADVGAQAKITIGAGTVTYWELFNQIKKQTGLTVVYSNNELDKHRTVEAGFIESDLRTVLDKILTGTRLTYEIMDEFIVLKVVPEEKKNVLNIVGQVTDKNKVPLPGVTVIVKGSNLGTATDQEGRYRLNIPEIKNLSLLFSFIGMKTREVVYTGKDTINVVMEEEVAAMDEVVVTGIYERKRSDFTGSASTFTAEKLKEVGNQNILQSLKSLDPAFAIVESNEWGSDPNRLPDIEIRGKTSIIGMKEELEADPNQPLFILDGFETTLQTIIDLDMDRVASITILKDAASTAIYGSKAANGVVVVETKTPAQGKLRVTYSGNFNFQLPDLSSYNLMNAQEKVAFEEYAGRYKVSAWGGTFAGGEQLQQLHNDHLRSVARGVDTYWLSEPLQMGFNHRHNLYAEGGDEHMRYGFGLRWVLSIPFFISCIRQQNPLTVLSKIILRKVKQFNLPPQKKMRDFCIFEDTPRLFLLGNRQFTFIAHNLDVAEDVVGQICHRHIRLCPYNPYCPDNKAVHTLLFKTEYVLDKATGLGLAPVLSLLFFCQRMIPTAFLADYRIHAMLLHG